MALRFKITVQGKVRTREEEESIFEIDVIPGTQYTFEDLPRFVQSVRDGGRRSGNKRDFFIESIILKGITQVTKIEAFISGRYVETSDYELIIHKGKEWSCFQGGGVYGRIGESVTLKHKLGFQGLKY